MRMTKKITSIVLAALMVMSLFVAVPITASAVTQNDINDLYDQMHMLAMEREEQDDYDAASALYSFSTVLDYQFYESGHNTNDPNVERAYNIASAVYNHFNGTGSVDVTSVSRTEVDKLSEALEDLMFDSMMSGDRYNAKVLDSADSILRKAANDATTEDDPKLLSAYSLASFILAQYTGTTGSYTVTWKNGDTTLETDADVESGAAPSYGGATPTKASDSDKHYTFSGWSDGTNTYGLSDTLPNVTADVTYTAQFTEDNHAYTLNPTFNWTQDASTGDWNCNKLTLTCTGCDLTQDYEVAGFFGASAVTCTANADGSFTYSVSKKVDGTTYNDTKTYDANGVVKSATQLKAAAKKGGSWELGSDIDQAVGISCADGFVLDGKNHTVTRHSNVATNPVFVAANKNAGFTLKNLTIDGIANQTEVRPAVASAQTSGNAGNVINLENVKIVNWDFDQTNNGAVLAWGQATVNMKNCDVDTDSDYDVWGGAASTVNIDGGKAGTVYLNGGTSSATVDNGAAVTVETSKPESVTIAPGYALNDNGDGTYTVVIDNSSPLNPIEKAAADIDDGNLFGINCDYLAGTLLGVQKKTVAGEETSSQEGAKNMRFVAVLDTDLVQDADDYGFVLAKVTDTTAKTFGYDNTNFDNLKANMGNGEKTISAKGTHNNVCGNEAYGDPSNTNTDYKYITCAVNNVTDDDKVIARFYYKKDGKTYYAKYAGHNYQYTGCIAAWSDLP